MEIFKWAKDLEKIYIDLIEKSKKENLEEIQIFKIEQEANLTDSNQKRQNLVREVLKALSDEINKEIASFKDIIAKSINIIVKDYEEVKPQIIDKIIQQLSLDLNA